MAYGAAAYLAVAAIIGAGVSAYGQYQSSESAYQAQLFNARRDEQNARLALLNGQTAAAAQRRDAESRMAWAEYSRRTAEGNAKSLRDQMNVVDRAAREAQRRRRLDAQRQLASMRAAIARSGTTEEGSPEEALAGAASTLELETLQIGYEAEVEMRSLYEAAKVYDADAAAAAGEREQARFAKRAARHTAFSGRFQAGQIRQQSSLDLYTARANRAAGQIAAWGGFIQSAGSTGLNNYGRLN